MAPVCGKGGQGSPELASATGPAVTSAGTRTERIRSPCGSAGAPGARGRTGTARYGPPWASWHLVLAVPAWDISHHRCGPSGL